MREKGIPSICQHDIEQTRLLAIRSAGKSYHYVPISCLITQFFRKCTSKWRRFLLATNCLDLRGLDKRNSVLQVTLCEPRSRCWTGGSEERIERRSKIRRYACCMHPALIHLLWRAHLRWQTGCSSGAGGNLASESSTTTFTCLRARTPQHSAK